MNKLDRKRQIHILNALVEGVSLRAASRMADVSINTVTKLLVDVGAACRKYQDETFQNLTCKRLQCDEIWSFVYAKDKNVPKKKRGKFGYGDVWTWTALDAETKLIPCWYIGTRGAGAAYHFMRDLAGRLANRVQLTTDGHKAYLEAVENAFGSEIDYAMLQKIYGTEKPEGEVRYSPAQCMGAKRAVITGKPDFDHVSTSYSERHNLSMRMGMRRFTRLTNGFSKKIQNHAHAIALYFMHYNFVRIHKTLRVTPAMASGITTHLWTLEDIIGLLEGREP
ncbi:MAG: DDE-type integrase/transposase/recombinase [Candidatus Omnitrophica bacterium]|nr:DDE-type integrase/transposase/recombinase [Candidatus Omnitrophota bacterium]